LRRQLFPEPDSYAWHLLDRIGGHVEVLDAMFSPTAAEILAWSCPGDDEAVDAALAAVDSRVRMLRSLLGVEVVAA
jgi:hypothetical protein